MLYFIQPLILIQRCAGVVFYRFPVVTWRHPRTRAVLLRASGFHGKGVMEMLKGKPNAPSGITTIECILCLNLSTK